MIYIRTAMKRALLRRSSKWKRSSLTVTAEGVEKAGSQLVAAFEACADQRHGGHPQAAGSRRRCTPPCGDACCRSSPSRWAPSRRPRPAQHAVLDLAVEASEVDYRLLDHFDPLGPIAPGDPDALVGIRGLVVGRVRAAADTSPRCGVVARP